MFCFWLTAHTERGGWRDRKDRKTGMTARRMRGEGGLKDGYNAKEASVSPTSTAEEFTVISHN